MKPSSILKISVLLFVLLGFNRQSFGQSITFSYTGSVQQYTIPAGVTLITVDAIGALGGTSSTAQHGGYGGRTQCLLTVTPGQVLFIFCGGQGSTGVAGTSQPGGFNDSGANGGFCTSISGYGGAGGGGASDIRIGGIAFTNRVVVAGGGGGGGCNCFNPGGNGGGLTGGNATSCSTEFNGIGGSQVAGGSGGTFSSYGTSGSGVLGLGGIASTSPFQTPGSAGGGGGGGYYGGSGGSWGGGGGGSSYTHPTLATSVVHTQGYNTSGNGSIIIMVPCTIGSITGNTTISTAINTTLSNTISGGIWSSSNNSIATVGSSSGIVHGVAVGTAIITYATSTSCRVTTTVTVNAPRSGINFDGVNDSITTNNFITNLSFGDFTLECWVKTTGTSEGLITKTYGGSWNWGQRSFYIDATGKPAMVGFATNYILSDMAVNDGQWHHIACTWILSSLTGRIYIDGVNHTGAVTYYPYSSESGSIVIGGANFGVEAPNVFSGSMDEVRIWDVAHTQSEVISTMNCSVPQQTHLKAYYRFDEGTAAGDNTVITNALDYSGNNICGRLNNFGLTGTTSNYVLGSIGDCSPIAASVPGAITGNTTISTAITTTLADAVAGGTWSSSNTSVATIGTSGKVTGLSVGTSIISYTIGCNAATAVVTVNAPRSGIKFDGTNDYISTNASVVDLSYGAFTLETWVKTTGVSMGLFTKQDAGTSWDYGEKCFYLDAAGKPTFVGYACSYINSSTAVNDGQWHHIALTWSFTGLAGHIYVDGIDRTTSMTYYPAFGDYGTFNIGNGNYNGYTPEAPNTFSGTMDEIRVWNVARTQSQIQSAMNCSVPQQTGLVAYYRFDEGTAGSSNTTITNAVDYSGNNICGLLNNFTLTGTTSNYVTGSIGDCSPISMGAPTAITGNTTLSTAITTTLADATPGGIWSSSNTAVATIGTTGKVTGLAVGTSLISYTIGCNAATTVVTVNAPRSGINFDGVNDTISTNNFITNLSFGDFTLECWVKTTGTSEGLITKTYGGSYNWGQRSFYIDATGKPAMVGFATNYILSDMAVNDGQWHHIACTWILSGLVGRIYIDGVNHTGAVTYYPYSSETGSIVIGGANFGSEAPNVFSGSMDEVRIWDVARTQSQVQSTMNCTVPAQTHLKAYYRFDEGVAGGSNTGILNANDYSGNNYCGRLYNFGLTGTISNYVSGSIGDCSPISTGMPGPITGNTPLAIGNTTTLADTVSGGVWSSNNTAVATVGSTGVVTGISAGTTTISYAIGCNVSTAIVTVNTPHSGINTNGTSSYVAIPNSLSGGDMTIEYWMKTTSTGATGPFVQWYEGNGIIDGEVPYFFDDFGTSLYGNKLAFGMGNPDTTIFSTSNVNTGNWVHVAATWSHTTGAMKLYINGVLESTITGPTALRTAAPRITIGMTQTGAHMFNGTIDEVRLWNTVRTQSQIQANMNCDVARQSNLVGYYRFDEGVAGGTNTSLVNVPDYSGNSNCGSFNGFALTGSTSNYVTGAIGSCNSINMNPPAPITGTLSACPGGTTTLSDTSTGGMWSSGDTAVATVNSGGVVTGITSGTTTITYSLNCSIVTAIVRIAPVLSPITGETTVCVGSTSALSNATTGGTWSVSNTNATIGSTGIVSGVSAGAAIVTYRLASGCYSTAAVNINALPTSTFSVTPNPVCLGTATTFSGSSTSGTCTGKALSFNGTTGVASLGSVISSATSDITLEAWVNWDGTGSGIQMMMVNGNTAFNGYALMSVRDTVYGILGNVTFMKSGALLTPHVWTHLALVCNASHVWTMYQNGVATTLANNTLTPNNPSGSGGQFYIGADPLHTGEAFHGNVDEAKFWTVARSQSQIQADMTLCSESAQSNLIGYYPFNEGTGTSTADASGNGHNLTITAPTWINDTLNNNITSLSFGDGASSIAASVVHTYTAIGTYTPTYTVTSRGCSSSTTKTVAVNPIPLQ